MNTFKRTFWIMFIAAACATPVFAQQSRFQELEDRIGLLENRVLALEATVQELIQQGFGEADQALEPRVMPGVPTPEPASSEPAEVRPVKEPSKDIRGWRKLERGMMKQDVVILIGEPRRISKYVDGSESWSYYMGGQVSIGPNGRVTSWSEPP